MKLQELKRQIEAQYPGQSRIKALGLDNLPAGMVAEDPQARQFPPLESLRLDQLVNLLERGNPDFASGVNSIRVHPSWQNAYYQKDDKSVHLGLKRMYGDQDVTEFPRPLTAPDIIQTLLHEIIHGYKMTEPTALPGVVQPIIPPSVHSQLLGRPGGTKVPELYEFYDPKHHSERNEIPSNVVSHAIAQHLFPEQKVTQLYPQGYSEAVDAVSNYLRLNDYARILAEQGLQ